MESEPSLTRRACPTRKRTASRVQKTPKRIKTEQQLVSESDFNTDQHISTTRQTRTSAARVKQSWLQNSFCAANNESVFLKSSTPRKGSKWSRSYKIVPKATTISSSPIKSTLVSESQQFIENSSQLQVDVVTQKSQCLAAEDGYDGGGTEMVLTGQHLTTQNILPYSQRLEKSAYGHNGDDEDEEPYASQHRSFDDSDSLFAEIDIPDSATKTRPSQRKMSKKKEQQSLNRSGLLEPMKLEFSSDSSIVAKTANTNTVLKSFTKSKSVIASSLSSKSSCNITVSKSSVTNAKPIVCANVNSKSDDTEKLPRSSKRIQNAKHNQNIKLRMQPENTAEFDSDDAVLRNIDLNKIFCEFSPKSPKAKSPKVPKLTSPKVMKYNGNSAISPEVNKCISLEHSYIKSNSPTTKNQQKMGDHTKTPVGSSIFDRLKSNLRHNAKTTTPQGNMQKMRIAKILEAEKEAKILQQKGTEYDIGPFYGLPSKVQGLFESVRGISKLYDWQDECLSLEAVLQGNNLIYSLPTSGGKTLVAEILMLRELLCKSRDAVLILPFVAIVQEKVRGLSQFAVELDFLVEEYAGSKGSFPPKKRRNRHSLYICTIEKANSLVNSLIETERIEDVGLVVIDELHMLGEGGSRGATLEMTLTKLMHTAPNTQLIGMSATLNNIGDLQQFLSAEIYSNDFRPVKLTEYVKLEDNIYEVDNKALCPDDRLVHSRCVAFQYDRDKLKADPDLLAGLVGEVIPKHSCLLFCPTKKNCENVAELLCKLLPKEIKEHKIKEKKALLKALREDGDGTVCPTLLKTVPYGLAYHHSGLTVDERKLIEEAYTEGTLCLLCCTSTLAAGVNLPAKRVILRSPYVGAEFLSRSQYKQMTGRAGRAGIDSSGESVLILQKKDKLKMLDLVSGPCDYCRSSLLYEQGKGMRGLLLTAIGLKMTTTKRSVIDFVSKSLCHVQSVVLDVDIVAVALQGLKSLIDLELVLQKRVNEEGTEMCDENSVLLVTELGRAVFKGSVDIDRGPQLYKDLVAARESLCVANHLHLLYLVTPYDLVDSIRPNWMLYLNELSMLDTSEMQVANLVGVTESYIARKVSGQFSRKKVDEYAMKRFYLTLMLYGLWKQKNIWHVSTKFQQTRGFVQQLLSSAAAFASCVARFCEELEEFWAYQDLLSSFVQRLSYCVTMELIPLMEIPGVKQGRARQLYSAGYKTLQLMAHADPDNLVLEIHHMPRKIAKQMIAAAKMLLQEKAESLRDEAEEIEQAPLRMPVALDIELDVHGSQTTMWSDSQLSHTETAVPKTMLTTL